MRSVLVVDDDASIRDLLGDLLTSLRYKVNKAGDGNLGFKSYQTEPTDVVLLDMFMPGKDGLETLRDLLLHDPGVRVVAMTGGGRFGQVNILKPAIALGAKRILYKPITMRELQTAIDTLGDVEESEGKTGGCWQTPNE